MYIEAIACFLCSVSFSLFLSFSLLLFLFLSVPFTFIYFVIILYVNLHFIFRLSLCSSSYYKYINTSNIYILFYSLYYIIAN